MNERGPIWPSMTRNVRVLSPFSVFPTPMQFVKAKVSTNIFARRGAPCPLTPTVMCIPSYQSPDKRCPCLLCPMPLKSPSFSEPHNSTLPALSVPCCQRLLGPHPICSQPLPGPAPTSLRTILLSAHFSQAQTHFLSAHTCCLPHYPHHYPPRCCTPKIHAQEVFREHLQEQGKRP